MRLPDLKQVMVQLTRVPTSHERETRRGVALYVMQHISRRTHPVPPSQDTPLPTHARPIDYPRYLGSYTLRGYLSRLLRERRGHRETGPTAPMLIAAPRHNDGTCCGKLSSGEQRDER
ncbi:hypothetical protein X777_07280 [Ooceraea biroi]|uniref:Uncharacterized protein n=1 Tax=Ooceraea biroi TaxID=2015173 RepID=A0A026WAK6_OOCBI|nr:hypothetical protein X777_07280 [Ooceraea biroi]